MLFLFSWNSDLLCLKILAHGGNHSGVKSNIRGWGGVSGTSICSRCKQQAPGVWVSCVNLTLLLHRDAEHVTHDNFSNFLCLILHSLTLLVFFQGGDSHSCLDTSWRFWRRRTLFTTSNSLLPRMVSLYLFLLLFAVVHDHLSITYSCLDKLFDFQRDWPSPSFSLHHQTSYKTLTSLVIDTLPYVPPQS